MQTPQVSIWVPIIVGIIGLVSVVAGQLINAWREDRRLKRERDHQKQVAREEKTLECYTDLSVLLSQWFELQVSIGDRFGSITDVVHAKLLEFQYEGDRLFGKVKLLGTELMSEATFHSIEALRSNNRMLAEGTVAETDWSHDFYEKNLDRANDAIRYARKELGYESTRQEK
jgi:hypothetical protein